WSKIPSYVTLKWEDFPWPVVLPPQAAPPPPSSRSRSTSSSYSLSSNSSGSSLAHAKILEQIRQWHPDRFEVKYLRRVEDEKERERVKDGAGMVVRWLNEMLGRM
ncbi:hypothetical protein BDN72DRAFT_726391, partial [Pluteus cervinus]